MGNCTGVLGLGCRLFERTVLLRYPRLFINSSLSIHDHYIKLFLKV